MNKCRETTKRGTPCPTGVWRESDSYCFLHDPSDRAKQMRLEARHSGGKHKLIRLPAKSPTSALDVQLGLAEVIGQMREQGGKPSDIILGYRAYLDALELAGLEQRMSKLEEIANDKKTR